MSNQVFRQNLDDKKGPQPGGPYLIQMLFKEPVDMPDKDEMTAVMKKHIGAVECFCRDKKMAGFAALDHIAEFQDGKCPVQLMVMGCDKFKGKTEFYNLLAISIFTKSHIQYTIEPYSVYD